VEIDRNLADPPYAQLAAILRGQIERGEITDRVPSVRDLMGQYDVAMNTARRAIAVLVEAGIVHVVKGWGVFVVKKDPKRLP
jgi:DNA-binding GntR family transcriptional regulator